MRFTRLAAQLSGGGVTPHLPSTPVVYAILFACAVLTATVADEDASSSLREHHDDADLSSCPPDDQCDAKKWCSAIAAAAGADDKKSAAAAADEYDHGVKCLDEQVVDRCGCCRECVRGSSGLPCGGIRRRGVCAAPLECLADVAVGRIAEPHEEGTCHGKEEGRFGGAPPACPLSLSLSSALCFFFALPCAMVIGFILVTRVFFLPPRRRSCCCCCYFGGEDPRLRCIPGRAPAGAPSFASTMTDGGGA
ncbi:hypothetical protein HPB50_019644 [Hyalomma asiaticum]|uniref:Uncharacterized protein n=1 Tax=Hyalomma asiaticum TaxID=266040 RepID=A0ACB7RYQ2_HYAAI|nr:hypothetical protein HPB50_019644 [Hyalomma asiaticum]